MSDSDGSPFNPAPEILKFLRGDYYTTARDSIRHYEVLERERATSALVDVRDALDHLVQAARATNDAELQRRIGKAEDHLRRAAVESAQYAIESRVQAIRKSMKWLAFPYDLKRIVLNGLPTTAEVRTALARFDDALLTIRGVKADLSEQQANGVPLPDQFTGMMITLWDAHTMAVSLDNRLQVGAMVLWARSLLLILSLAGFALGVLRLF